MTGLTYPYTKYDRILGDNVSLDLEMNPKETPPAGTAGGAARYRYWMDTTVPTNASLRWCVASRATEGVYVPAEWLTLGTLELAVPKFHFNTDSVDFTGGTGPLIVHDLTVTGATNLNTLNVSGNSALHNTTITGTLSVSGASSLHDTTVTGALSVTGAITGASLAVTGAITGASLGISGSATIGGLAVSGNATVGGNLTVSGGMFGVSLELSGNLHAVDAQFTGLVTAGSLHVLGTSQFDGDITAHHITADTITLTGGGDVNPTYASVHVTGDLTVDGNIIGHTGLSLTGGATIGGNETVGGTLSVVGAITGGSLGTTGTITGGSLGVSGGITGATLNTSGDVSVGGNLAVAGNLTLGGSYIAAAYETANTRLGNWGVAYHIHDPTRNAGLSDYPLFNVEIGFSIQPQGTGGGYPNLDVWFDAPPAYVFTINAFYSDPRTKTNIQPPLISDALSLIRRIEMYSFEQFGRRFELGFMGDQLEDLIPNSIMRGPSVDGEPGMIQINANTMLTYALRSIQQLADRVEALEAH